MLTDAEELALMQKQRDEAWARIVAQTEELGRQSAATFRKANPVMTKEQAEEIFITGLMDVATMFVGTRKNRRFHLETPAHIVKEARDMIRGKP